MWEKIIKLLFYLFLTTIIFGQLVRVQFTESSAILASDVILSILLATCTVYIITFNKAVYLPPGSSAIILFILLAIISQIYAIRLFPPTEIVIGILFLIRLIIYISLYFVVFNFFKIFGRDLITKWLILISVIISLIGFAQLIILPDLQFLAVYGWDPHQNRLVSTFLDPNFLGGFLVLPFILIFTQLLLNRSNFTYIILGLIILLAIILTFSRSAYLMLVVSVAIIGLLRSKKILLIMLAFFIVSVLFIPRIQERLYGALTLDETARARIISWQNAASIAYKNPLLGVGYNNYRFAQVKYSFFESGQALGGHAGAGSDSSVLLIFATTGVFGLIIYLAILARLFYISWQIRHQLIGLVAIAFLGGIIVESQFVNSLFYPHILAIFWIFMGAVASKWRIKIGQK